MKNYDAIISEFFNCFNVVSDFEIYRIEKNHLFLSKEKINSLLDLLAEEEVFNIISWFI